MAQPQPTLASRQIGTGARQVLALHCTIAHSGAWKGVAGHLPDCTFTAPDMLSHGQSPDWDETGDFQDRMMDGLRPLLRERMDVIGHSFGGTLALRLAVEYPDLVRSVTLIEPVLFAAAGQEAPEVLAAHDADAGEVLAAFQARDWALAARLFNRMWATPDSPRWPELPEATRAAMTRAVHIVPGCSGAVYHDAAGVLAPGVPEALPMPVLLLRGSLTHPVIEAVNNTLARRLGNATNLCIPGAGHMLPISHPAETAEAIAALFATAPV